MNKKRIGFTLVEIIIALVIMGFIATIGFQTIQIQKTSYTNLAYFAYNNLKTIVGEIILTEMQGSAIEGTEMTTFLSRLENGNPSGLEERVLKDDELLDDNSIVYAKTFCDYMFEIMNTQGENNCKNSSLDFTYYDAMDKAGNRLSIPDEPHFRTTNGQKYYIGKHQKLSDTYEGLLEADENLHKTSYGYRIIAVDLNGDAKPNIAKDEKSTSLPVDIVTFAIVDNGEVLPLGVAANNLTKNGKTYRYLTSKLYGYIYRDVPGYNKKKIPEFCTNTKGANRCNYSKENLLNKYASGSGNKDIAVFTFRQAYCNTLQIPNEDTILTNYCDKNLINKRNTRCPCANSYDEFGNIVGGECPATSSSTMYDVCKQEIIKPMFRYNFK